MGIRRLSRECTLQFLYACDLNDSFDKTEIRPFWGLLQEIHKISAEDMPNGYSLSFADTLIDGVLENLTTIDKIIKEYTANWNFSRITVIDRNILRISIFEILFYEDVPFVVSINEAVDIAKKYSTPDSGKFVNGILDKIRNNNIS